MVKIAEHSIDTDMLPLKGNILDLGCRGFGFTLEMMGMGHNVYPVDIDYLPDTIIPYYRNAISDFDGNCGLIKTSDEQATRISKDGGSIACYTLKSFSEKVGVKFWDLIKIDVEGSEYEIIMSLTEAPAKQLSIEFHLHTGIYTMGAVNAMENKLSELGYVAAKHDYSAEFGAGLNYWDSLFLLK